MSPAMKTLLTITSLQLAALPAVAGDSGQGTALPMRDFDRKMDSAHANCASKDLEFSAISTTASPERWKASISTAAQCSRTAELP